MIEASHHWEVFNSSPLVPLYGPLNFLDCLKNKISKITLDIKPDPPLSWSTTKDDSFLHLLKGVGAHISCADNFPQTHVCSSYDEECYRFSLLALQGCLQIFKSYMTYNTENYYR